MLHVLTHLTLTKVRRGMYHYTFYITDVTESGQDQEVMVESSFELKPSDSSLAS